MTNIDVLNFVSELTSPISVKFDYYSVNNIKLKYKETSCFF